MSWYPPIDIVNSFTFQLSYFFMFCGGHFQQKKKQSDIDLES